MASAYLTFDIQVDPCVQVFQALVAVPTAVCPSVLGVRPRYLHQILQILLIHQIECSRGPSDRAVTMTTEGEGGTGCQHHLSLVWQEVRVQMDQWRTGRL